MVSFAAGAAVWSRTVGFQDLIKMVVEMLTLYNNWSNSVLYSTADFLYEKADRDCCLCLLFARGSLHLSFRIVLNYFKSQLELLLANVVLGTF